MTDRDAENSSRKNVILQALGPAAEVKVAVTGAELERGDHLVLCSDGLSGLVDGSEIAQEIGRVQDPAVIASNLIELANSRGGHDNITVVIAQMDGAGLRA
jgi:serine/threonine protein phosphatase PrpC